MKKIFLTVAVLSVIAFGLTAGKDFPNFNSAVASGADDQ